MRTLVIETESIFEPIEVKIDGVSYQFKKISPGIYRQFYDLQKQAVDPDTSADVITKQFCLLFGVSKEEAEIDIRVLNEALQFIMEKITEDLLSKKKDADEKNGLKAGDTDSPQ